MGFIVYVDENGWPGRKTNNSVPILGPGRILTRRHLKKNIYIYISYVFQLRLRFNVNGFPKEKTL